jgi:hypothetical protein
VKGEFHAGNERLSTQAVFDHLGVRRRARNTAATRRLSRTMRQLGWTASRWRSSAAAGQRIRGFIRPPFPRTEDASSEVPAETSAPRPWIC